MPKSYGQSGEKKGVTVCFIASKSEDIKGLKRYALYQAMNTQNTSFLTTKIEKDLPEDITKIYVL